MQKTLAYLLVAVVAIVGWQAVQKYKHDIYKKLNIPLPAENTTGVHLPGSPPGSPQTYGSGGPTDGGLYPPSGNPAAVPVNLPQAQYPTGQAAPANPAMFPNWTGAGQPNNAYSQNQPLPNYPPPYQPTAAQPGWPQPGGTAVQPAYGPGFSDKLKIASFNIQVLGEKKVSNPAITRVLAEILRRFDVVAVQEVRSVSDEIIPRLLQEVNAAGRAYDYVIGPRLGRTNSKEQYVFIFDTATVEIDRAASYTVNDPQDLLHREPLVCCFRARNAPPQLAFTFTLINIHTDPDEVAQEVNALAQVVQAVRNDGRNEDDVILLGDLNASEKQLGELGRVPGYAPVVVGVPTNTRGNRTYDNLVYSVIATEEYTRRWGVVDYAAEFGLAEDAALAVSDHRPVWAEYSIYEGGRSPGVGTQLPGTGSPLAPLR
ncbi:MAG: endonuclease/exonuclease/phosphatase family protein [Pirellulales bacterium]|nr:endonuclease/exonuclease/phosphatase family protein [Pirellulales bacterium]